MKAPRAQAEKLYTASEIAQRWLDYYRNEFPEHWSVYDIARHVRGLIESGELIGKISSEQRNHGRNDGRGLSFTETITSEYVRGVNLQEYESGFETESRNDSPMNAFNNKQNAGTGKGQRALSECWDEYFLWSKSNNERFSDSSFLDFLCTGKSETYPKAKEESNLRKSKADWRIRLDPALEPISWKTLTRFVKGKIE